ncbi:MAG: acyl-CoA dehydrogenase [Xanthomonadales bacterium]|nr:acyl-CoA dehydrogenase [Xanthomonadales bacterium]
MADYKAPVRDMSFVVNEVLKFDALRDTLGYTDATPDTIDAVFEEAGKLASEVVHPLNQIGDAEGAKLNDGVVTLPDGFKTAFEQYQEAGWATMHAAEEFGGMGMPHLVAVLVDEMFSAANHSWYMYASLTHGAVSAIQTWGTDEQKATFLPKMATCEWTGTMNLTEPHAGTDLGMLKSRAEPNGDGSYSITGTKIFISCGEHEMSENIVHLVLAKLPDAPAGTKGISMFIVPKFLVNDDGSLGERNSLKCGSVEHKMGIKASATCVMNYEGATGYLIGAEHGGLKAMFTMMNAARLGVGVEGLAKAALAYQYATDYAKERIQGRALTGPQDPGKPADNILVHPDVRKMLLTIRSFVEGGRLLAGYCAMMLDVRHKHPDDDTRTRAEDIVSLLTPVIKAFFTDEGFRGANLGMQCYGGHGYIVEWGAEQIARDARISMMYEGTNGVQAMDLVGRKLFWNGGRGVKAYFQEITETLDAAAGRDDLKDVAANVRAAFDSLQEGTQYLLEQASAAPNNLGSAATDYLRLFAVTAIGAIWLRAATVAQEALDGGSSETAFYAAKPVLARFFAEQYVAEHSSLLARVKSGADTIMALEVAAF